MSALDEVYQAGVDCPVPDPMKVNVQSQFANCVLQLFSQVRPTRLIETGTYGLLTADPVPYAEMNRLFE